MKFKDIKEYTCNGYYQVNSPWIHLEEFWTSGHNGVPLIMDPDYQRDYVWTLEQKSKFIEHCLRGGKQGKDIWLNCPGWMNGYKGPLEVVDGKQRINAVLGFLHNEVPIFGNNYYKDFEDRLTYDRAEFIIHVNDLETRAEVLQWYIDLNDGGTVHTKEEIERVKKMIEIERSVI